METFRGAARRVVAASSIDVYRACWSVSCTAARRVPAEPVPLTEDSPSGRNCRPIRRRHPDAAKIFHWLDDEYDKIPVERAVLGDPELPGTVLRLPMMYGPGDRLHRFHPVLKRIDDGRRQISSRKRLAGWRSPRGYVDNVAAAMALAAVFGASRGAHLQRRRAAGVLGTRLGTQDCGGHRLGRRVRHAAEGPYAGAPGPAGQPCAALGSRFHAYPPRVATASRSASDDAIRRTIDWERANPPDDFNPHPFDYAAEDLRLRRTDSPPRAPSRCISAWPGWLRSSCAPG